MFLTGVMILYDILVTILLVSMSKQQTVRQDFLFLAHTLTSATGKAWFPEIMTKLTTGAY